MKDRVDEELFGPLLSIIRVADFDAAIAEANNTAYGLSAGILTDNKDLYKKFIHRDSRRDRKLESPDNGRFRETSLRWLRTQRQQSAQCILCSGLLFVSRCFVGK